MPSRTFCAPLAVRSGKNARMQTDILPSQTCWVTGTIEPFVMLGNHGQSFAELRQQRRLQPGRQGAADRGRLLHHLGRGIRCDPRQA